MLSFNTTTSKLDVDWAASSAPTAPETHAAPLRPIQMKSWVVWRGCWRANRRLVPGVLTHSSLPSRDHRQDIRIESLQSSHSCSDKSVRFPLIRVTFKTKLRHIVILCIGRVKSAQSSISSPTTSHPLSVKTALPLLGHRSPTVI